MVVGVFDQRHPVGLEKDDEDVRAVETLEIGVQMLRGPFDLGCGSLVGLALS